MFCVLEMAAMRDELDCVHSESSNDILSPIYKPAYDISVSRLDTKIYIDFKSIRVCTWKIEVGW
jgi:hypothetical protein